MAQFTVNPQRFDPYKNFKFRVKWDGRYVAGISKVSALKRTTEVVEHREGGDPSTSRKSPGRTKYEAITLERGVTHDTEFEAWANKVWNFGSGLGAEVSLKDFRKDVIIDVYNEAGQLVLSYKVYRCVGLGVPGAARPRRERERRRDPAHQARERGLGARRRGARAGRAGLLGAVGASRWELSAAATPRAVGGGGRAAARPSARSRSRRVAGEDAEERGAAAARPARRAAARAARGASARARRDGAVPALRRASRVLARRGRAARARRRGRRLRRSTSTGRSSRGARRTVATSPPPRTPTTPRPRSACCSSAASTRRGDLRGRRGAAVADAMARGRSARRGARRRACPACGDRVRRATLDVAAFVWAEVQRPRARGCCATSTCSRAPTAGPRPRCSRSASAARGVPRARAEAARVSDFLSRLAARPSARRARRAADRVCPARRRRGVRRRERAAEAPVARAAAGDRRRTPEAPRGRAATTGRPRHEPARRDRTRTGRRALEAPSTPTRRRAGDARASPARVPRARRRRAAAARRAAPARPRPRRRGRARACVADRCAASPTRGSSASRRRHRGRRRAAGARAHRPARGAREPRAAAAAAAAPAPSEPRAQGLSLSDYLRGEARGRMSSPLALGAVARCCATCSTTG